MENLNFELLEHGKFYKNNFTPSEFYNLIYTSGMNRFSKDLRDTLDLDLKTPFSSKKGNVSFAFIPAFGKTKFAFVQFQSRFENEFRRESSGDRPFFQTRFLISELVTWRKLYEDGLAVFPSLVDKNNLFLTDYSSVVGEQFEMLKVSFKNPENETSVFHKASNINDHDLNWVSTIASAILDYKDKGGVYVEDYRNDYEKLILIDAVMRILLPVIHEPVSFALTPACTAKVMLRFGGQVQGKAGGIVLKNNGDVLVKNNNDLKTIVESYYKNRVNWQDLNKKIYTYPTVASLRSQKKEKDSLLFLCSYITGDIADLFMKTNGSYDNEIIPLLLENQSSLEKTLKMSNEQRLAKLFTSSSFLNLSAEDWFGALLQTQIPSARFKNYITQYIEAKIDRFAEIFDYFVTLPARDLPRFELDKKNIIYDLLKKVYSKNVLPNQDLIENVFYTNQLARLKKILLQVKHLSGSYNLADEWWFWAGAFFVRFMHEEPSNSIGSYFSKIGLSVSDYPDLFYKVFVTLRNSVDEVSKADIQEIKKLAKKNAPNFIELNIALSNKQSSDTIESYKMPKVNDSITPTGYINILPLALQEKNERENEEKKSNSKKWSIWNGQTEEDNYETSKNIQQSDTYSQRRKDEDTKTKNNGGILILIVVFVILTSFFILFAGWMIRLGR